MLLGMRCFFKMKLLYRQGLLTLHVLIKLCYVGASNLVDTCVGYIIHFSQLGTDLMKSSSLIIDFDRSML